MTNRSDGSTASYYQLPPGCTELQDLISYRNLNAQDGEMFRAIYRKGRASHSDELRDARKVLFYAQAEVKRLEALAVVKDCFTAEPASLIDDESPRMQAIGQNGNDGAAYADIDRLRTAADFANDVPVTVDGAIALGAREPQQPRHRCLACAGGHATHECGAGN